MPFYARAGTIIRILYNVLFHYIIPYWYIILTIGWWNEMEPCIRREALLNNIFLFYLRFADVRQPNFLLEIVQILTVLWILQRINIQTEGQTPECYDTSDSLFLHITHWLFNGLLWVYTISACAILLMFVGAIAFFLLDYFLWQPRRVSQQGLSDSEFKKLKQTDFVKDEQLHANSDLATCTICLEEFTDGMRVVQLPCNHFFHKNCIKSWLTYHTICPNCRSNIRGRLNGGSQNNLEREHDEHQNASLEILQDEHELQDNFNFGMEMPANANVNPNVNSNIVPLIDLNIRNDV